MTPDALKIGLIALTIREFHNLYPQYLFTTLRKDSPKNERMDLDITHSPVGASLPPDLQASCPAITSLLLASKASDMLAV